MPLHRNVFGSWFLLMLTIALLPPSVSAQRTARPVLHGRHWVAITGKPLGATAGAMMFQKGGNAVDAAVTVGFALGPAEPQGSSIGGDGFVMVHMRNRKLIRVANGTGAAPLAAKNRSTRHSHQARPTPAQSSCCRLASAVNAPPASISSSTVPDSATRPWSST